MSENGRALLIDQYRYGIVDVAALPEDALPSGIGIEALVPELLAGDSAKMPGLVCLSRISGQVRAHLQDNLEAAFRGEKQHLLSCLLNTEDACEPSFLRNHLTRRLILDSPSGKVFLRYYDPRVFEHLEWILEPSQRRALFGPITEWAICCPCRLRRITRPETGSSRWYVGAERRRWLDRVGLINQTLKQAERHQPALAAGDDRPAQALPQRILAAITIGERRYGLTHDQDLIAFATHALRYGDDFHERGIVQTLFASLAGGESTYADASPMIDKNFQAQGTA